MTFDDSMSQDEFLDFLFSKVVPLKDDFDLQDDDACVDHLELEKAHQFNLFES